MNSARNSLAWKAFIIVLLACCAVTLTNMRAMAQDPTTYTEEQYKAYQDMQGEKASAQKIALAIKFLQAWPKSGLREHVIAQYHGAMAEYQKAGNWSQIMSSGEKFLDLVPDDNMSIGLLAEGYQQQKNYRQFVVFGEKIFPRSPNANLAYALAKAYLQLGNDAKFIQWGEKTVSMDSDNHEILMALTKSYGMAKRWPEATKYANQCLQALDTVKKPEGAADAQWTEYVNGSKAQCYAIIGNAFYEQKKLPPAIQNLEKSLSFYKRNDVAYYFLGMSYWQSNRSGEAMLNFAKAYLLKGQTATASKQYLDQLYKAGNRGSLVGQERIIDLARKQLGF